MSQAVIYCRVSTKEQVEEGSSLEVQEKACRQLANNLSLEIDEKGVFIELGESAKTADRTQLIKMMDYCTKNRKRIDNLIIYKVDRLSRDTNDYLSLKKFFNNLGITISYVSDNFEDNPAGRFMETVLAGQAQFDNEVRAERCVNGSIELVRKGMRNGLVPIGYKKERIDGERKIVKVRTYSEYILKAFEMLATGLYNPEEVRFALEKEGFRGQNGKPIAQQRFHKIIRNPIYKGVLVDYGQNAKGSFEPIVSSELFDKVQDILTGKKKKMPKYVKLNPIFPLRGTLLCPHGKKLTGSIVRGNGGLYPKYRARCEECEKRNFNKSMVHTDWLDHLSKKQFDDTKMETLKIAIRKNWEKRNQETSDRIRFIDKRIIEIENKKDKVIEKTISGVFTDDIAKQQLDKMEQERKDLEQEKEDLTVAHEEIDDVVDFGVEYVKDLVNNWQQVGPELKQRFQNFFFKDGLTYYGNQKFGTEQSTLLFRLNSLDFDENYALVDNQFFNWNQLVQELKLLYQIFSGKIEPVGITR